MFQLPEPTHGVPERHSLLDARIGTPQKTTTVVNTPVGSASLSTLVGESGWKNIYFSATGPNGNTWTSAATTWWTNPVYTLPSNPSTCSGGSGYTCVGNVAVLNVPSAVYVLDPNSGVTTQGYNIAASNIAIAPSLSSPIVYSGSGTLNFYSLNGGTSTPDSVGILASPAENFLWIEGVYAGSSGTLPGYGIFHYGLNRAVLRNLFVQTIAGPLMQFTNVKGSVLSGVKLSHNTTGHGFYMSSSSYNRINWLSISDTSGNSIYMPTSSNNVFQSLVLNGGAIGIYVPSGATTNNTFSTTSTLKFTGNLIVGINTTADCSAVSTSNGITSTCAIAGSSTANVVTSQTLLGAFASVASDSYNSTIPYTYGSITNWVFFDSFLRNWGIPWASGAGSCASGTCYVNDFRISATNGGVILNDSNSGTSVTPNHTFINGANCISELSGSAVFTDFSALTYLQNAVEVPGDFAGNDNGLCETGETCMYTPNFGAYQGDYTSAPETCIFQNGTISNVTMLGPNSNGI